MIYDLLFKTSAEAMLTIAADPNHLGAEIGITAVLHSWGLAMTHHPHVHMIVPGGGISLDGQRWVSGKPDFLLPVPILSKLFRGLFLTKLASARAAGRLRFFGKQACLAEPKTFAHYLGPLWKTKWYVNTKRPFAGPNTLLAYLSRYTHRVANSNNRLISADETGVTFRWKGYRCKGRDRYKPMRLPTHEFIRRVLSHVLPKGLHRILYGACPGPHPGGCSPMVGAPRTWLEHGSCSASPHNLRRERPTPPSQLAQPRTSPTSAPPRPTSRRHSRGLAHAAVAPYRHRDLRAGLHTVS